MNITAFVHFSVPYRMAGSETMLHTMLVALAEAGHTVRVVTSDMEAPPRWDWGPIEGISVNGLQEGEAAVLATHPDVIISHHQNAVPTIRMAKAIGAKSVFIQHNNFPDNSNMLIERPDLVVFNTQWVAEDWGQHAPNRIVVHPPVWAREHATTPGDHITMINLNRDKGALIFYQLAKRFPHIPFLGVMGSHGPQCVPAGTPLHGAPDLSVVPTVVPPNVEIIPQTTDMKRDVWSRTRILVVPSIYESYGMVAVEAMASGIPVVAAPTPGLRESLGIAGIFSARNQIAGWVYQLRRLLEQREHYEASSRRCLLRSAALDPKPELERFVLAVEALRA